MSLWEGILFSDLLIAAWVIFIFTLHINVLSSIFILKISSLWLIQGRCGNLLRFLCYFNTWLEYSTVLQCQPIDEFWSAQELVHHFCEFGEGNEAVSILVGFLNDLFPYLVIAKLLVAWAKDLFELFRANLAVAVFVEVSEGSG